MSKRPDLQSPLSLHRQKSHSEPERGVFLLPLQSLPVSSWLLVQGVNRAFSRGSWVLPRNSTQQTLDRKAVLKARSTVNTRDPLLQINPGQDSLPVVFLQKATYLHSFPAPSSRAAHAIFKSPWQREDTGWASCDAAVTRD